MYTSEQPLLAERLAPHYLEAEEAVLGSVIINPEALRRLPGLAPGHFYLARNQWIFEAILALTGRGDPVDFLTVRQELESRGQLAGVGGPAYLAGLLNAVPTAIHAEAYAAIVLDAARRRGLLEDASDLAQAAYDGEDDGAAARRAIDRARARLDLSLTPRAAGIAQLASDLYDDLADPSALQSRLVPWGLVPLDRAMGGGQERGTLAIVAARPSMGKSATLTQISLCAAEARRRVFVCTQEHNARQWLRRIVFAVARADWQKFKQGQADEATHERLLLATQAAAGYSTFHIDGTPQTSDTLIATARRLADEWGGLDLVITDHLSLFLDSSKEDYLRVGRISRQHKRLAVELDCAVVAAAQLSRKVEDRADKRPILPDLRDSGEVEQNADDVWMLYRDGYYNPGSPQENVTEFWPRKLRDGDIDSMCKMVFVKQNARFEILAKQEEPSDARRYPEHY